MTGPRARVTHRRVSGCKIISYRTSWCLSGREGSPLFCSVQEGVGLLYRIGLYCDARRFRREMRMDVVCARERGLASILVLIGFSRRMSVVFCRDVRCVRWRMDDGRWDWGY